MSGECAAVGAFAFTAQAMIVASGGIGGNHDLVRQSWPARLGDPPRHMLSGVPEYVDERMLAISEAAGGAVVNRHPDHPYSRGRVTTGATG